MYSYLSIAKIQITTSNTISSCTIESKPFLFDSTTNLLTASELIMSRTYVMCAI